MSADTIMVIMCVVLVVGMASGAVCGIVMVVRLTAYMKKRNAGDNPPMGPFGSYSAMVEYFRTDDPAERRPKLIMRLLAVPFFAAWLVLAFVFVLLFVRGG